eukprot:c10472_g1_i1.p1 GENE.c10472_g1_i1~~c10472_g1_i1.p1  ORF type:complete len:211 (+),score=37.13 c10472_g1_i1:33-665(+)
MAAASTSACATPCASVLQINKPAPAFKAQAVVNGAFKDVSNEDFHGRWLVLFFYPLDFTFVCPTEIIAFSDRCDEFQTIGCDLAAVSVDSVYSHLAWIEQPRKKGGLGEMKIPLISDITKDISRAYNVLIEDGPDAGISLRGLFIIDPAGNLRQITVNDLPIGRSVDEVLRLVKAYQFHAEHGEVCPANWTPGQATINTENAKPFFESQN